MRFSVKKSFMCALFIPLLLALPLTAESSLAQAQNALVQGFEAYRNEDWTSAMFFLRKAVSVPGSGTDETWYMLIMSEMYAADFATANADCDTFLKQFAFSQYVPYVQYQKGRALHFIGKNENAILVLSDFCHQNPTSYQYPSALYWIAESFFAEYNYEASRALYERIVVDFPDDSKVAAAKYRIDSIDQRSREEKLLYLLKVTGEENLAAREDYERQLRQYQTEDKLGLRQQLSEAQNEIAALNQALEAQKAQVEQLKKNAYAAPLSAAASPASASPAAVPAASSDSPEVHDFSNQPELSESAPAAASNPGVPAVLYSSESDPEVEALKRKARQLQYILEEQSKEGAK